MKYLIKFRLGKDVFERAIDPRMYLEELKELGKAEVKILEENIPSPEETPTQKHCFKADVILETEKSKEEILELLEFILEDGVSVETLEGKDSSKKTQEEEDSEIPSTLLKNYKIETEEILSRLRTSLEELLENPGSLELVNEIFRNFHTLKGNTALLLSYKKEPNLEYIHQITHKAESVLQKVRDSGIGLTNRQAEVIGELVDRLDDLFLAFSEGREEKVEDIFSLLEELDKSIEEKDNLIKGEEVSVDLSAFINVTSQYIPLYRELCSKEELTEEEKDFFRRSLMTLFKISKEVGFSEINKKIKDLQNAFGNIDFKEFCENLEELSNKIQTLIEKEIKPKKKEKDSKKTFDTSKYVTKTEYLKIEEKLIRDLMDIVGELSVFKEWIILFSTKLQKVYRVPEASKELKDRIYRFRGLMESLQRTVLEMRMIPVSTLFERFPKLIRDLSRTLNKRVRLEIEGGDTKLDKVIIEKIAEPMIHLIRNAVDHGIESPEERERLGKPPEGLIKIRAFQEGGNVFIEISDDGRGIDPQKIKKKALEIGLYSEEELNNMAEEEIIQIVFQPGFSTKERATELSGRGVGMDVVANTLRNLGGEVYLYSEKSLGTTVRLSLPLTLAIRKILLFRVGSVTFGIPAESVGEVLKVNSESIKSIKGLKVLYHRGRVLELDSIADKLGVESKVNGFVTLLVDNSLSRAVVVDEVLNTIDTVVKPLPPVVTTSEDISGVTILGDGSIVYILEVLN